MQSVSEALGHKVDRVGCVFTMSSWKVGPWLDLSISCGTWTWMGTHVWMPHIYWMSPNSYSCQNCTLPDITEPLSMDCWSPGTSIDYTFPSIIRVCWLWVTIWDIWSQGMRKLKRKVMMMQTVKYNYILAAFKLSVQFGCSVMSNSLWPHGLQHARPSCPSPTPRVYSNSCPLSWWCHPTISSSVIPFSSHRQSFPAIRVFSNESVLRIMWPEYWSFSFSISPSNEYSGLISFRMDWLDLLAVQGTLKNLLQHHSSKASILRCSAFFPVQLSHPYMTTGKTIALTRWTLVGKVNVSAF